jgi:enoyl-[acyl-carrier protein] reductase III
MNTLVTGASRGIGRAIAIRLAAHGGDVVVNYLQNESAAEETADAVRAAGGNPILVQADVRNPKDLQRLVNAMDRVDVLVHNAAMGVLKPMEAIRTNQWDLTMESSLRPFWLLTKLCLDRMPKGACVVGVSSLGSRKFVPGYAAMGAAKSAMEGLTRQMAVELAPRGIRVNTVTGGLVDTDALNYFPDREKMLATAEKLTPLGRVGRAEDIASAVELMVLPQASWITGHVLVADGGISLI